MASNNVIGALQLKYASLGFTPKPAELWFDGIDNRRADSTAITLPTAEIQHHGTTPQTTEEGVPFDTTTVVIVLHAVTLEAVSDIAWGIKYDTGLPTAFLGFDGAENNATAFPLTRQKLLALRRTGEKVNRVAARDPNANQVHRIELTYVIATHVTG